MKKYLLIAVAVICAAFSANAQTSGFMIKAGAGGSSIAGKNSTDISKYVFTYKAGIGYDYALSEYFSLQPSLMFAAKGFGMKSKTVGQISDWLGMSKDGTMRGYYLEMPILGSLKLPITQTVRGFLNFGPTLSVGVAGDYFKDDNFLQKETQFNRFDLGVQVGAGVELGCIIVGAEFNYGCLNLHKNFEYNNISFGANVGFKF
jgi:hypothetical protein